MEALNRQSSTNAEPTELPQQVTTAVAGTKQTSPCPSIAASLTNASSSSSKPPVAAPKVLAMAPTFLLHHDQFRQVMSMNTDNKLWRKATAMDIDADGKSKTMLLLEITRFTGSCDSLTFAFTSDT